MITAEQIPTIRRDLDLFSSTLYAFSISLRGMSKTTSVSWNSLGFPKESLKLLKQSGVKLSNIPVFTTLNEYALELQRQRTEIEERTLFVAEQRVVTESQINEALAEYNALSAKANELRQQLKASYQEGRREFHERITCLLATPEFRIPQEQQPAKVDLICASFITYEAIDGLLRPELHVRRIPSLSEQIQEQTALRRELNELQQAERQAEAESALSLAQEQDLARSESLRESIFTQARAEIENIVAEQIEAISKYESETPDTKSSRQIEAHHTRNAKARAKLTKHLKRMQVLFEVGRDDSVASALERLQEVSAAMESNQSGSRLETVLANLQTQLKDNLQQISTAEPEVLETAPSLI